MDRKLLWCSDIHLNFAKPQVINRFYKSINKHNADGLIITGDISEAPKVFTHLDNLAANINTPIYYVFGNHDFYSGSINDIRNKAANYSNATYLGNSNGVRLNESTVLIGDDGWYDGLNGDYHYSDVELNDFYYIDELNHLSKFERKKAIELLTQDSADRLGKIIKNIIIDPEIKKIIIATHVPPFAGAGWYQNHVSDDFHLPFFSNRLIGEVIMETTKEFREYGSVQILCGHTHGSGKMYPGKNAECLTAWAMYGNPKIFGVISA